jgi:type II secretory ATPase GspE/PulE/Tfp pilus assembly ATPase PilB-like protein
MTDAGLTLAMADPLDFRNHRRRPRLRRHSRPARARPAAEAELLEAIDKHYGEMAARRRSPATRSATRKARPNLEQLRDMASEAPVDPHRQTPANIASAVEKRASDIHIEALRKDLPASASASTASSTSRRPRPRR